MDLVEPANLYQQLERSAKYGLLFVILRSQDNALLMGSILLFAFIAAVMIGTRKVDWYRIGSPVSPA